MLPALHTVAETSGFIKDADAERMPGATRTALRLRLAVDPEAGDLIVNSGGIRKLRVAGKGKGKSGGYRVLTAYLGHDVPVYLLAVLSKNDRETFTDAEVEQLAKLTASIKAHWRGRRTPSSS